MCSNSTAAAPLAGATRVEKGGRSADLLSPGRAAAALPLGLNGALSGLRPAPWNLKARSRASVCSGRGMSPLWRSPSSGDVPMGALNAGRSSLTRASASLRARPSSARSTAADARAYSSSVSVRPQCFCRASGPREDAAALLKAGRSRSGSAALRRRGLAASWRLSRASSNRPLPTVPGGTLLRVGAPNSADAPGSFEAGEKAGLSPTPLALALARRSRRRRRDSSALSSKGLLMYVSRVSVAP
mmetsp:Transcript_20244/g.77718  ORF Transcript_20244/g.77718 Transcript_20244/m.77718 type:complete len:244 (-) Transcript_20244:747-1478(-)